jgi:uncharacterized protein YecE (DUF72 family)
MLFRIGTSGFSYPAWKGSFYPEKLPAKAMLAHYATKLNAVEINNTFYRMPKSEVIAGWAAQVPEGFRFSVKASQRITHHKRLKECAEEVSYLFTALEAMGDRLGVVLFQLPPNLKADAERLAKFLDIVPERAPIAFEFRHASWVCDEVLDQLRARGAAACLSDTDDTEGDAPIVPTARRGYLRLRREAYSDDDLKRWIDSIKAQDWDEVFLFFKHEDAGVGPALAQKVLGMVR